MGKEPAGVIGDITRRVIKGRVEPKRYIWSTKTDKDPQMTKRYHFTYRIDFWVC